MPEENPQLEAELASAKKIHEWKQVFRANSKTGVFLMAKDLVSRHSIKTIGGKKDREIYLYADGVYEPGQNHLSNEIQNLLEELGTTRNKNEIIGIVKDLTVADREKFDVNKNYINVANGILDINTGELLPHSPDFLFMYKLPVNYDPKATCPNVKKFLGEILNEIDIPVVQEWFGYGLYRSYFIKKAMIFVGERDTGKTTLLRLLSKFIGTDNVAGISLQRIATDKFAAAQLYNKHVNIYDDLSFKDIHDNGAFKIATGGGIITGEYKFGDQFQFENYGKLIFACNKIPNVEDANDDAYFSRWIVIQFNKAVAKADKFLIDKLSTPEELSGVLNFALEGLKRLLDQHDFSYAKDPDEIKMEMLRSGSIIANYVYDELEQYDEGWISKEEMYEGFTAYARGKLMPVGTLAEFGKKLPKYATYLTDGKKLVGTKQQTGWRNVKFKSAEVQVEDIPLPPEPSPQAQKAIDILGGELEI